MTPSHGWLGWKLWHTMTKLLGNVACATCAETGAETATVDHCRNDLNIYIYIKAKTC